MKLTLRHAAAIILVMNFAAPAVAGQLEDADAAVCTENLINDVVK